MTERSVAGPSTTLLDAALAYADRGWPVFPCHPQTKRPLTPGSEDGSGGLKHASTNPVVITEWWKRFPQALIGVRTGKAIGAFVVDLDAGVDAKTGESHEILNIKRALVSELGAILPSTWVVETPRGGQHLYFQLPEDKVPGNRAGLIDRVDIRGEGGYVILPPSMRPDGRAYRWIEEPKHRDEIPAKAPAALLDCIFRRGQWDRAGAAAPAVAPASSSRAPDRAFRKYVLAALDNQVKKVEQAQPGSRNQALNDAALSLGHLIGASALAESIVRAALEQAAYANGLVKDNGLSAARATISSGLKAGIAQPCDLTKIGRGVNYARKAGQSAQSDCSRSSELKREATSRRSSSSSAADDEGPAPPRPFGFDIDRMNEEFALVLMGSKAVVFFEQPGAMIEDQKRMLTIEAFQAWFANCHTETRSPDGKVKSVTWSRAWLQSRERRSYRGIEFRPDPNDAPGTPGYLNLWSGFAVKPAAPRNPLKYKTFRDHLQNNVCGGDDAIFNWVFGFFAHIVQRPRERVGVALVMRGKMGSGKTKVGEVFGSLYPRHYFMVDDPRYVTGQFNAHMATCLLLQADEAVWAGDKAAEGRLKGLVTSPIQQIEAKGVDPIRLPNYVRLIMTSNEDWVVPAAKDERRFCVLDVDPRCAQNHDYFREMDEELANGGLEHLLADLLTFDLDGINLRQIPRTKALLEQKIRSLDSVESWWFDRLLSGSTTRGETQWREQMACAALFDGYIHAAEKIGIRRKQEETVFGMKLVKLMPGLQRVRRMTEVKDKEGMTAVKRVYCYLLPPLSEAREFFEELVGQQFDWPNEEDGGERAAEECLQVTE